MIRLYREIVKQLVAVLEHLQSLFPNDVRHWDNIIQAADQTHGNGPQTLDELRRLLDSQVKEKKNVEGDLIDLMVKAVGLAYAPNRWTPDMIKRLRKVLLIPNEFNALQSVLKKQELRCLNCKRELFHHQLVVLSRAGNDPCLYCTTCQVPSSIAAEAGERTIKVSKSLLNALKKNAQLEGNVEVAVDREPEVGVMFEDEVFPAPPDEVHPPDFHRAQMNNYLWFAQQDAPAAPPQPFAPQRHPLGGLGGRREPR